MNLVVDFGNTRCKCFLFDGNSIVERHFFASGDVKTAQFLLNIVNGGKVDCAILSSVGQPDNAVAEALQPLVGKVVMLNSQTPLPIENCYNKTQLGNDRLAAAVGATVLFPERDVLVVDAGTAITYEFVEGGKRYLGGSISPGLSMRFASLHEHTARLPLVSPEADSENIANDTQHAINNGVVNGIIAEILWNIEFAQTILNNPSIILTGGDTIFLAEKLKNTIFAEPNLVAIGLNRILQYNVFDKNI